MPDGTYGQYEDTRQGAQPVELYKFYWGNGAGGGTSAGDSTTTTGDLVVGSTLPACDSTAQPTSVLVDTWTAGPDTDINGRVVSPATWTKIAGQADIVGGVLVHNIAPTNTGFYLAPGHGLGDNQSCTVTGKFTATPAGLLESTWFAAFVSRPTAVSPDDGGSLYCTLERIVTGPRIKIELRNNAFQTIQTYLTDAFTVGVEHTVRIDRVGTNLYGYLDGDLVVFGTDTGLVSGEPGFDIGTSHAAAQQVAITRWEAGVAVDPGDDEAVSGYGRDLWNGTNDTEINGRQFDGGGSTCLADAEWVKTLARPEVHGDIVDNTLHVTERTDGSPKNWTHYVATGLTGLGDDYRIESTVNLLAQPIGTVAPDSAWGSLIARHSATTESGYEFIAQFVASAAHGGDGLGGMAFNIDRIVAESYTELVSVDRLTGEVALGEHTLAMHVEGNRICGYFDGELVVVAVDPLNLYPTGYPGICLCGDEVVATSWTVFSADQASSPCAGGSSGALLTLNYTSADVPITYEGEVYTPFIAHRTNFRSGSGERTASEIELSIPVDHEVASLAMLGVPRGPIGCVVYRLDRQDTSDGAAAIPLQGQITRHRIEGRWCTITLGNVGTLLTRKLPRMLTQRSCPHVFGGPFCLRDLTTLTHAGLQVMSAFGRTVIVEGASTIADAAGNPEYFAEGVIVTAGGLREFIESQSGDTLTVKQEIVGLGEGDTVTLQAGCKHTALACDTLDNIEHFGGEVGMPDRNPFTGAGLANGTGP